MLWLWLRGAHRGHDKSLRGRQFDSSFFDFKIFFAPLSSFLKHELSVAKMGNKCFGCSMASNEVGLHQYEAVKVVDEPRQISHNQMS